MIMTATPTPQKVAQRIRMQAARMGISHAELAKRIGISKTAMNEITKGRNFPRAQTLAALAVEFGVTTDYLLGLSDE